MTVACLALFVALSGTAYAAATIGSADVIDNSLQSVDLKDGAAVKGADVTDDSILGADVKESTLTGVARKFSYQANGNSVVSYSTIMSFAGITFKGACLYNGSATFVFLSEVGPSAWLEYALITSANSEQFPTSEAFSEAPRADRDRLDTGVARPLLALGGPDPNSGAPYMLSTSGNIYRRAQGTAFLFTDAGDTIRLDLSAIGDNVSHKCSVMGTISRAV
jgi:hypothetical protein